MSFLCLPNPTHASLIPERFAVKAKGTPALPFLTRPSWHQNPGIFPDSV